jgi:hypothetical protein
MKHLALFLFFCSAILTAQNPPPVGPNFPGPHGMYWQCWPHANCSHMGITKNPADQDKQDPVVFPEMGTCDPFVFTDLARSNAQPKGPYYYMFPAYVQNIIASAGDVRPGWAYETLTPAQQANVLRAAAAIGSNPAFAQNLGMTKTAWVDLLRASLWGTPAPALWIPACTVIPPVPTPPPAVTVTPTVAPSTPTPPVLTTTATPIPATVTAASVTTTPSCPCPTPTAPVPAGGGCGTGQAGVAMLVPLAVGMALMKPRKP